MIPLLHISRRTIACAAITCALGSVGACAEKSPAGDAPAPDAVPASDASSTSDVGPASDADPDALPQAGVAVTLPPVNGQFDYQIGGAYTPQATVAIVDRDRSASPVTGKYNICYINALQTQPDEPGQSDTDPPYGVVQWWKANHPELLVHDAAGNVVIDEDWDEAILDVSTAAKRDALAEIQRPWIKACADAGFQAIEPDNLDSYARSQGAFTFAADSAYMQLFVAYAHALGIAVAQKNTSEELGSNGKAVVGFDFAIAEECQRYDECDAYTDVFGDHVIEIEYNDYAAAAHTTACALRGASISIIRRDRDVVPAGSAGYLYTDC